MINKFKRILKSVFSRFTKRKRIPVTVFTGFLGSGKTTIITNIVKEMPPDYKIILLKNEFGDVMTDSQIAKEQNISVKEMINGCLCCVLVGKLKNALEDIIRDYNPDRIIIETSGSAYPAPIVWELDRMKDELRLDGVITVIDAQNFEGYKDKSYTAKLQAKFTDLILINKHEGMQERELEDVLDDVYELNPSTPKVKTEEGRIDPGLIFGVDVNLAQFTQDHHDHEAREHKHQRKEVDILKFSSMNEYQIKPLIDFLASLPKWDFYRIKGMVKTSEGYKLVNYCFGNTDIIDLKKYTGETKLVFIGKNLGQHKQKIEEFMGGVLIWLEE